MRDAIGQAGPVHRCSAVAADDDRDVHMLGRLVGGLASVILPPPDGCVAITDIVCSTP